MESTCFSLGRRDGGGWKVVLFDNGIEVGYADIRFKHEHAIEVVWFQIYDQHRDQGYGEALLRDVVAYFPSKSLWIWSIAEKSYGFWLYMKTKYPIYEE